MLMDKNAKLNQMEKDGKTALGYAAEKGHLHIVEVLLEKGADFNMKDRKGRNPLHLAAIEGHEKVVSFLLGKGAEINEVDEERMTSLQMSLENGNLVIASMLIDNDADINKKNKNRFTALHSASKAGYQDIVIKLVEKNVSVNVIDINGRTPLSYASENGHSEVLKTLLKKGSSWGKQLSEQRLTSNEKEPLHFASEKGHLLPVSLLLSQGHDPNCCTSEGTTPLMFASQNGHTEVASKILEMSTDGIDMQDKQGRTAIQFASEGGWEEVVALLIQKGANVDIKSNFGTSPLEYAAGKGHKKIISMLLIAPLDPNDIDSVTSRVAEVYQYIFSNHFDIEAFGVAETMFYFRKDNKTKIRTETNEENNLDEEKEKKAGPKQQEKDINKSLVNSIVEKGHVREREQILDLLVKVEKEKQKAGKEGLYDPEECEYRVIEKIKCGIPSSVGLAEALRSLSDRFPWTRTKMIVMFIISFVTNILLGSGFYLADIVTDFLFSKDMFEQKSRDFTEELKECTPQFNEFFNEKIQPCHRIKYDDKENQEMCLEALRSITINGRGCFHNEGRFTDSYAYEWTYAGIVCAVHIGLPLVISLFIWVLMEMGNFGIKSFRRLPIPMIAKVNSTYYDWKFYNTKTGMGNEEEKNRWLKKIEDHKDLVNLSLITESGGEASFQFFFQERNERFC